MVSIENPPAGQLVWYITGTSSGFGKRLVLLLLARGDKVIATARSLAALDFPPADNLRVQELDVTEGAASIARKVEQAVAFFGRVDVLVNNAGTGAKGTLEESGSAGLRAQFDVNVFGLLDVTNAFLPHMRKRRSGTVVLLGSRSSWAPETPTGGLYAASKAAVRALGETLHVELAPFAIRILIVEPGAFRTEGIFSQPLAPLRPLAAYDALRTHATRLYAAADGAQPGCPSKAMALLADVVRGEGAARGRAWPLYLPLGREAEDAIRGKCARVMGVLEEWGPVIRDTRVAVEEGTPQGRDAIN